MDRTCNVCGKTVMNGAIYCTACGNILSKIQNNETSPAEQAPAPQTETEHPITKETVLPHETPTVSTNEPLYEEDLPVGMTSPTLDVTGTTNHHRPLSIGMSFWILFLFFIPVVGWIAAIIFLCASSDKSVRNLSVAFLLWVLLGLIVCGLLALFFFLIFDSLLEYFNADNFSELIDTLLAYFD